MKDNLLMILVSFTLGFSFKVLITFDRFEQNIKQSNLSACSTGYSFGRAEEHLKKSINGVPEICQSYNP